MAESSSSDENSLPNPVVLQLKISLKHMTPKIWRRLLVSSDDTFLNLHSYIQEVMGWRTCHLHEFTTQFHDRIGDPVDDELDSFGEGTLKEGEVKLSRFLRSPKDKVTYLYDFGDNWEHEILVEKILPYDDKVSYPKCTAGKKACPPEDCGGVGGYQRLLRVLANPKHREYNELITNWLNEYYPDFDPNKFDLNSLLL